ncbi:response regulator transcription factor [Microbacterium sp. APC 3898]|uniref:Response regulator transcription factor n=1 Tax=Planococcus notacanthi TaxID=3035188 RepID=A0ABT7ZJZ2_9BACL|nr:MULTISPECIES: response regulator transcription factor [Terrabacteria group]MDN3427474.1 response regulator transcription factor [Planococcus sp. APC 4016]MDN3436824.1 response regulator transcription factor [Planococcus sp. APC 3900]MDN3499025.1 response regulator transcription factor [Microbacterium sp. APC 3898]
MDQNITVLICDDNIAVHESINAYLEAEGMKSVSAYDGEEALRLLQENHYNLVVLDIMMPGIFGTDVCREIRKTSDIPIIMLSARSEEMDRIIGLEIGADDYLTKPFSPREVVVRIKKMLKRVQPKKENAHYLKAGNLSIDLDGYEVLVNNQEIELTPKEVEVLAFLVKNSGKVINREELLHKVWGYDYAGDTRTVDTLIKRIRQKVAKASPDFSIRSVYGVGYKFEVGV